MLVIHPDDPLCSILGLVRIMSCAADFGRHRLTLFPTRAIVCLWLCTGSLGVSSANDCAVIRCVLPTASTPSICAVQRDAEGTSTKPTTWKEDVDTNITMKASLNCNNAVVSLS